MSYTLIRNGTLIDGNGGSPIADAAVLLHDNRIHAVGREAKITLPNVDYTTIDAAGGTILPGLIDTHVHMLLENVDYMRIANTPFSYNFYQLLPYLRRTLDAGITTVRDAGGADLGLKQAIADGLVAGPRMQISVSILGITGGHIDTWMRGGSQIFLLAEHPGRPDGVCDGVDGVRKKVRQVLRAGADVIKICATGGVLSPTDHPEFTQFSPEELDAIVREAGYRRGTKVMAHAQGLEGVKNALRAGVHSIEHGIWLDDEAFDLFHETGAFLVPTLLAPAAVVELSANGHLPPWAAEQAREIADIHRDSIRRAHKAGVKIAMGTDAGVMPHGTNLRELGLMCDIGMTPLESLTATTRTAAECLGWGDSLGTIEVGKKADIVIAATDVVADIRSLENNDNVTHVLQDGVLVKG